MEMSAMRVKWASGKLLLALLLAMCAGYAQDNAAAPWRQANIVENPEVKQLDQEGAGKLI